MNNYEIFIAITGGFLAGVINTFAGNGSTITLGILTEVLGLSGIWLMELIVSEYSYKVFLVLKPFSEIKTLLVGTKTLYFARYHWRIVYHCRFKY